MIPRPLVLLAEDDVEMRRLLASTLRRRGYRVSEAANGTELCDRLFTSVDDGDELPAVVVSDVRMPGLTGLAALRGLRRRAWATPFVLITAWGDNALHREAEDLGAIVLDKPFDLERLLAAVAGAVGV